MATTIVNGDRIVSENQNNREASDTSHVTLDQSIRSIFITATSILGAAYMIMGNFELKQDVDQNSYPYQAAKFCKNHLDKILLGSASGILLPEGIYLGKLMMNHPNIPMLLTATGVGICIGRNTRSPNPSK